MKMNKGEIIMMTMNEKDKNEMLGAILAEGETYQCKPELFMSI